tara:strand:- start:1197 stop:2258 length:1062 start_codon:yes stop_codon:yes gene_type:complete
MKKRFDTFDTIESRSDEILDHSKVSNYLKGRLDGSNNSLDIRQFPGGKANLTYLLDYGTHEYVLRRPPLGPIPPGAHDMKREYSVLSVLHKSYQYAPKAFIFEEDDSIIGAPFFVMERKKGVVIRTEIPFDNQKIKNFGKKISIALINALAELHNVNFHDLGLDKLGIPEGFIERQVYGWNKRWNAAKVGNLPEMDQLFSWLKSNIPYSKTISIIHNDFKLDNAMFSFENPESINAIFDWDMCTIGDPLSDLGTLLCYWMDEEDPPFFKSLSLLPKNVSFLSRKELISEYTKINGIDISKITFYHVLGLFRLVGIIAQIYTRYVRGQTKDKRFEVYGDAIPMIARYALKIINN